MHNRFNQIHNILKTQREKRLDEIFDIRNTSREEERLAEEGK